MFRIDSSVLSHEDNYGRGNNSYQMLVCFFCKLSTFYECSNYLCMYSNGYMHNKLFMVFMVSNIFYTTEAFDNLNDIRLSLLFPCWCRSTIYDQSKKKYFFICFFFLSWCLLQDNVSPSLYFECVLLLYFKKLCKADMISLLIYDYYQEVKCRYHISNMKTKRIIWSARNTNYQVVTVNYIYLSTKLFSCQCLFKWNILIKLSKPWAKIREKYITSRFL
jgi:hypothetical protein